MSLKICNIHDDAVDIKITCNPINISNMIEIYFKSIRGGGYYLKIGGLNKNIRNEIIIKNDILQIGSDINDIEVKIPDIIWKISFIDMNFNVELIILPKNLSYLEIEYGNKQLLVNLLILIKNINDFPNLTEITIPSYIYVESRNNEQFSQLNINMDFYDPSYCELFFTIINTLKKNHCFKNITFYSNQDLNINHDKINYYLNLCGPSITKICFVETFNPPINTIIFPEKIETLEFGLDFSHSLNTDNIKNLKYLYYIIDNSGTIKYESYLPESIHSITYYNDDNDEEVIVYKKRYWY